MIDQDEVAAIVRRHTRAVREHVAAAEIHLSGSASVPGLPATDVDLVLLVSDVAVAAERLRPAYTPLYEEQWSADWAAFRVTGPPQVDLVLTRRGSAWDAHHRRSWELLRRDERLLAEYADLKRSPERYAERKAEFFERLVRLLPPENEGA